jgi:preprotein translocase subunit SecD
MTRNPYFRLTIIIILVILAVWVDSSNILRVLNPFDGKTAFERNVATRLGLDLRGGLQVILEADLPESTTLEAGQMDVARTILENRTNAFGVSENSIQLAGERRIVGEFPGLEDSDAVLSIIQQQGLLEFVDFGTTPQLEGTIIQTDYGTTGSTSTGTATPAPTSTSSPTPASTETSGATPEATPTDTETPAAAIIYHTVMTGADLKTVSVTTESQISNQPVVAFELSDKGSTIFSEYTTAHQGEYLGIVLDKQVISSPQVDEPITSGSGIIRGGFTYDSANALAIQLRYGSLPVPLKVVNTLYIGPTLGEDSLQKSLIAGIVGMLVVILFMALYYRLPGMVADISILVYALLAFSIFKFFHFTLTLPGIAGFLLSTGAALDANILIFERIKEELRNGLTLANALDKGWKRAWPSIRDSNIATIITSLILFWFGSSFGATIVKGFSLTLALGVVISLFTALFVTRTLLGLVLQWTKPTNLVRWFGI